MDDLKWEDEGYWWLLRLQRLRQSRTANYLIYTRLYKPNYYAYPVWTVRFVMGDQGDFVQLDPTLTLDEAKNVAKTLSVARRPA